MKHLLMLVFVPLLTFKAAAQRSVIKSADTVSFQTICASLVNEAQLKEAPVYILSVKEKEYTINKEIINRKMLNANWISATELIAPSDEGIDKSNVPPPTIIFKLNTKAYPRSFDRLKRYLTLN